jgi:hypothetical protein
LEDQFESTLANFQKRLHKWDNFPLTICGKVIVANHLVLAGIWYVLTLNSNRASRLQKIQQLITNFIWQGQYTTSRNRVRADVLILPTLEGGLGLLDVVTQAKVLGARVFFWTLQPGSHPLQKWVQFQL